jgi:hypothetical protein
MFETKILQESVGNGNISLPLYSQLTTRSINFDTMSTIQANIRYFHVLRHLEWTTGHAENTLK